ncbi:hypothetical protein BD408DRAFT_416581, partial [Parasitella parasitica]
ILLLYTLMLNYLQCKRVEFVFITAGIIIRCTSLVVEPITRKQYARWCVSGAVVPSVLVLS